MKKLMIAALVCLVSHSALAIEFTSIQLDTERGALYSNNIVLVPANEEVEDYVNTLASGKKFVCLAKLNSRYFSGAQHTPIKMVHALKECKNSF